VTDYRRSEMSASQSKAFDWAGGRRGHSPDVVEELVGLGADLLRGPKWHDALGSFNGEERSRALDLIELDRQVTHTTIRSGGASKSGARRF